MRRISRIVVGALAMSTMASIAVSCNSGSASEVTTTTTTPFHERLVWFWTNHFAVSIRRFPARQERATTWPDLRVGRSSHFRFPISADALGMDLKGLKNMRDRWKELFRRHPEAKSIQDIVRLYL